MKVDYGLFGRRVNAPEALARVRDRVTPPAECPKCRSTVDLVNHAEIYGKEYGWPLLYLCCGCGARVGTHPGTDIPLGTLADERTIKARRETHGNEGELIRRWVSEKRAADLEAVAK